MESNSLRRNIFNIHSTKEPFNPWLNNPFITEYVNTVKTVMFDRILPDGHTYKTGRINLLTNLRVIKMDNNFIKTTII